MRIGVVVPWCHETPHGGAERHALMLVKQFNQAGHLAEILTTTGQSAFHDWSVNYFPAGIEEHKWGTIRRFKLDARNDILFKQLSQRIQVGRLNWLEEQQLLLQKVSSREMYAYVHDQGEDYVLMAMPYYYGIVHWALRVARGPTVLIPCLHDEPEAYMRSTKFLLRTATKVFFNSLPEYELAKKVTNLHGLHPIVTGVPVEYVEGSPMRFRRQYGIKEPFLLYVGRKVKGKGIEELISTFHATRERLPLPCKLVVIGPGDLNQVVHSDKLSEYVIDLGELDDVPKADAMAAAVALCHFSRLESFSLVLMEAWLQHTPVIVPAGAPVLKYHVMSSGGGWILSHLIDFSNAVTDALLKSECRAQKGILGYQYALQYTGNNVTKKILGRIECR